MIAMDDVILIIFVISLFLIAVTMLIFTTILKKAPETKDSKLHRLSRNDIIDIVRNASMIIVICMVSIACICAAYMMLESACV